MDWRVLVVLGPILLALGWAGYNIFKATTSGEAKLFGDRGNTPWKND
ncbi:photosystem II protein Y [Synechococcus sp. PCC 7336]|nr:photosystem II protein Y [Synechococcus sp. PCC 7336]